MNPPETETLTSVAIRRISGASHLAWSEGRRFSIPPAVLSELIRNGHLDEAGNLSPPPKISHGDAPESEFLRLRAAFTDKKPLSSRLPVSYQRVPPRMRSLIASLIGRGQRRHQAKWATFPKWPLDLSADFLNDLITGRPSPYGDGPTPVLLTHDLDSGEGLENLCKWFLDLEESVGARSTNYIVPKAWPIDHGRLRSVRDRGHDIGIHGYDHSNISPFLDSKERRTRLEAAHELVEEYGILGYRSPSLLRTKALLKDLSPYYLYDSSIPTSGGLFPIPNNGCASARPFRVEGIAELPITLPRDGSLRFLGYSPQAILDTWIDCAREISRSGGIVVLLTHCEARFSGNPAMRDIYRRFLEFVTSAGTFVWRRAAEVLEPVME